MATSSIIKTQKQTPPCTIQGSMCNRMDILAFTGNGSVVEVEISAIQGVWWACLGIILGNGIGLCGDAVLMEIKRLMVVWWARKINAYESFKVF